MLVWILRKQENFNRFGISTGNLPNLLQLTRLSCQEMAITRNTTTILLTLIDTFCPENRIARKIFGFLSTTVRSMLFTFPRSSHTISQVSNTNFSMLIWVQLERTQQFNGSSWEFIELSIHHQLTNMPMWLIWLKIYRNLWINTRWILFRLDMCMTMRGVGRHTKAKPSRENPIKPTISNPSILSTWFREREEPLSKLSIWLSPSGRSSDRVPTDTEG